MKLYLVQHARAKDKEEDPQRGLTEKGWEEAQRVADFLVKSAKPQVTTIFHSGKTRARQTAEAFAKVLHPIGGLQEAEGLDPMAETSIWRERLREGEEDLMLVGHLPHLERLCSRLVSGPEEKPIVSFQNAGVVCLARSEGSMWEIQWIVTPSLLTIF
jgi:phosphohistidine phosphatase